MGVFLFSDLLLVCYTGCRLACLMIWFNSWDLRVCASICAFACVLTPLTYTSPVAEQRQREASTENISLKVTSQFSSPLLCPSRHPITRKPRCSPSSNPPLLPSSVSLFTTICISIYFFSLLWHWPDPPQLLNGWTQRSPQRNAPPAWLSFLSCC